MKRPQIVVYEADGWLAAQVRRLANEARWQVREARQPETALKYMAEARVSVLLLKLEKDLFEGLTLLSQAAAELPDCPVIVVSDVKMDGSEQRLQLTALVFDLGARYILFPPLQVPVIEDLVAGLMQATITRVTGTTPDPIDLGHDDPPDDFDN